MCNGFLRLKLTTVLTGLSMANGSFGVTGRLLSCKIRVKMAAGRSRCRSRRCLVASVNPEKILNFIFETSKCQNLKTNFRTNLGDKFDYFWDDDGDDRISIPLNGWYFELSSPVVFVSIFFISKMFSSTLLFVRTFVLQNLSTLFFLFLSKSTL